MKLAAPVRLRALANVIHDAELIAWDDLEVSEVTDDSRKVRGDAVFIAAEAPSDEGWRHVADAQRRGALAIVIEPAARERYPNLASAAIVVPNARRAMAELATWACDTPARDLLLLGVTGTNGKTTTTHMLTAILRAAGISAGHIGTLGAQYGDTVEPLGYTTPPPLVLQPLLRKMRYLGIRAVSMEVSSHALSLERVTGLQFAIGVFTNLTRDHLDFHGTLDAYIAAKRQLFRQSTYAVINIDDEVGRDFFAEFGGTAYTLDAERALHYRAQGAPVLCPEALTSVHQTSRFMLDGTEFVVPMPGRFNVANALAALAAARHLNIADADIARGLILLPRVPGRMERFEMNDCTALIDYAHTPDALARVLEAAREGGASRLTVVFGCGGGRDAGKRPEMGAIAERLADRCILTSDNPRNEDPAAIVADIRAGMRNEPEIELDRAKAIDLAIRTAVAGETIVIAGKGAETEQWIGIHRFPFDDRIHAQTALAQRE